MNQVRAAFPGDSARRVLGPLRGGDADRRRGAASFFYPVAYRHQVASQYPVLVVDLDHSAMSRALVRKAGAVRGEDRRRCDLGGGGPAKEDRPR